ncbi:MAG: aminotransferase class I/II-fold pyridoxal phosphate-dependent enzyme [Bacteroidota bacterium]
MTNPSREAPKVLSYRDLVRIRTQLDMPERTATFSGRINQERRDQVDGLHFRQVLSPMGREVLVRDHSGETRSMLMFGSNNYLGLSTHPLVIERTREAVREHGIGVGGPPILNGHGPLHRELEERLAAFEHKESALVYGSGYKANLGLVSSLPGPKDLALYDDESHASFLDGLKLGRLTGRPFAHNDMRSLDAVLSEVRGEHQDVFVGVEGVYSMSGDVGRLDRVADVCERHDAVLLVDDAHGTGVTGPKGSGTVAMFDVSDRAHAIVGTFSKSFAVSGGFVAANRDIVEYLRYFSRPYVFSAAPSPGICAAVLAGLDLLEQEPEIHQSLVDNCGYFAEGLHRLGFEASGVTAIFSLPVPLGTNVRAAAHDFHRRGLFLNHIEAPAVSLSDQRFRVTLTAVHTRDDLDRLLEAIDDVWATHVRPLGDGAATPTPAAPSETLDVYEGGF